MEHVWFTHGISCAPTKAGRRDESGNRGTESESGGKRASAGKGRRGLENLTACWISFFPLEKIFTFSSVDYRRRLFKRIDARSGGRRSHEAPHVSVSTWLVRGRRNASLLVLSFVKLDARSRSVRCPLASLSPVLSTHDDEKKDDDDVEGGNRRRLRSLRDNVLSSSRVDTSGEESVSDDATLKNARRVQRSRGNVSYTYFFSLDQPGNFDTYTG